MGLVETIYKENLDRMKNDRRLNNITVRRCRKATIHSLLPIIVTQAMALAFPDTPRDCVALTFTGGG